MPTTNKFLSLTRLKQYDEKIKALIDNKDAATLASAKQYAAGLTDVYDAAGTAQTKVDELKNGQVKTNTDAITTLNGEGEGSVKKAVADAKAALEKKITDSIYNDSALSARVTANENAITTLNGEGEGSVKKAIDDAFNDFSTKVSDDSVVNTYKELIDYAAAHKGEAATMAGDIAKNKTAISNLSTLVGTLPDGTSAKTVVEYIDTKVGAVDFTEAIATAKQEAIDAAAADATTKAGTAETNAKTYADGLAKNYATAAQGAKADTALQKADIIPGTANGTISVGGEDVAVKGLAGAAYKEASAFEAAGTVKALEDGQVATNKTDIAGLKTRVDSLESTTFEEISEAEINAMFQTA